MKYFDAHTHVQFPHYDEDRDALLAQMADAEVGGLVVGVDLESSRKAVALVQDHADLYAAVGLHPNDNKEENFDITAYRELALDAKVIAIGECGLDNFRPEDPKATAARQREIFEAHIQLALELDKPLMIHSRPTKGTQDAYRDVVEILSSYKKEFGEKLRGDIHFFVGGIEEARSLLELGFTLSYTAVLTFTHDYDEVVRYVPLESLLSETDAPYIAPEGRRGKRNDSLAVIDVVQAIARIRQEDEEAVRETLLGNAKKLFVL